MLYRNKPQSVQHYQAPTSHTLYTAPSWVGSVETEHQILHGKWCLGKGRAVFVFKLLIPKFQYKYYTED